MSTRARTRAAVAAAAATASPTAPSTTPSVYAASSKSTSKPSSVKGKQDPTAAISPIKQQQIVVAEPYTAKENLKMAPNMTTTRSTTIKKQSSAKSKAVLKVNIAYCTCHRGDDGSPMIRCAECRLWYHFICVDLSEREAEEINVYICSLCTQSTGRRTAMIWEGIDALEDCGSEEENTAVSKTTSVTNTAKQKPKKLSVNVSLPPQLRQPTPSDDSDGADSADDYIAEDEETKNSSKTKGKRRLRRISSSDSSSSSEETTSRTSRRVRLPDKLYKLSSPRSQTPVSPALAGGTTPVTSTSSKSLSRLKRKASIAEKETLAPPSKRKRSDAGGGGVTIDPVRKYCLGKFEDVFKEVFLRYPYIRSVAGQSGETRDVKFEDQAQTPNSDIVMKTLEELTEEEKESLVEDSKNFAAELERCVFDNYSEGDIAGAKYKDRFRTLQFNLSKTDRIAIHQRIVMCTITPQEISRMSSTDLADEETKQNIKIAEKESLEQTILQKPIVPRAKITHKGLQDIEDVNGDLARARETEGQREREQEEEERRERERRERLRAVEKQQQKQRTLSAPPESPMVSSHSPITVDQQTWGAPPPVPAHVLQHQQQHDIVGLTDDILGSSIRPLFAHTMSDVDMATAPEPELNLADLINIDEDSMDVSNVSTTSNVSDIGDASTLGSSGDANATTTATDSTSSGIVLSPLEQPIESNGSISDKLPGVHHAMSGSAHLTTIPMSSRSSVVSPFSDPRPRGLSFDLNSLWQSVPKDEDDISQAPKSPPLSHQQRGPSTLLDPDKGITACAGGKEGGESGASDFSSGTKRFILQGTGREEPEPMELANDDDFDMFLAEEKDVASHSGSHETAAGNGGTMASSAASDKITSEAESHISQDLETSFESIQRCWTGKILMPLDTAAPQTTIVSAKQVGGRSLESQSLWWQTLFPSDELRIDGRVNTKSSEDFLTQTRLNQHKELVAVAFLPVSEQLKGDFIALIEYLKDRDRHGLIFPWGHRPKDTCPGREMYLVPLRAKEPLPEYIELLDELKIPGTRKTDLLIGIWILHRGRLNHPPPEPLSASTSTPTSAAPPTIFTPAAPTIPVPLMPNIPPLPPHLASAQSQPPSVPMPSQNLPPSIHSGAPSQPSLLAQFAPTMAPEVAPLTHDQVQNLLRSLSTNLSFPINLPIPGNNGPSAAPPPPPMLGQPHQLPSLPSHPWPGFPVPSGPPPSQPSGSYPPPGTIYGQPSHSHSFSPPPPPPPHLSTSNNDRRDSYGPSPNFHGGGRSGDRERGERSGWRGGRDRHQRGRGKHRGGGGANATPRPVDSGWPRRPRHDDGNNSPSRRWG